MDSIKLYRRNKHIPTRNNLSTIFKLFKVNVYLKDKENMHYNDIVLL